jgi:hypothetical protein
MMRGIVSLAISMFVFDAERVQRLAALARDMIFKAFTQSA